ncbi:hypothetical protein [Agaribacterium sp. ZY112]|uniref:hypothetical protein n=1 Tax=Agaribacterium sp. ZY112 TaxID=3233574 RepID=UPI0035253BFE
MRPSNQKLHSQSYKYQINPTHLKEIQNHLLETHRANRRVLRKISSRRFLAIKNYADGKYQIDLSINTSTNKPNLKATFTTPYTSSKSIQHAMELLLSVMKHNHTQWLKTPTLYGVTIESSFSGLIFPETLLLKLGQDYYPQSESDFCPHSLKHPKHNYSAYIVEGLNKHDKNTKIRSVIKPKMTTTRDFSRDAFKTFNNFDFHLVNLNSFVWGRSHIERSYRRGLLSTTTSEETKQALLSALEDTKHFDPRVKTLSEWRNLFKGHHKLLDQLNKIA